MLDGIIVCFSEIGCVKINDVGKLYELFMNDEQSSIIMNSP